MTDDKQHPELSRSVKFRLAPGSHGPSIGSSSSSSDDDDEDDPDCSGASSSFASRFRVTKVEAAAVAAAADAAKSRDGGSRKGSEDDAAGTNGARRPSSFETYCETQKTFGRNTLESLPHIDHYRNLFATGGGGEGQRQRPTLMELHEQVTINSRADLLGGGRQREHMP